MFEKIKEHASDLFDPNKVVEIGTELTATMIMNGVQSPETFVATGLGGVKLLLGYKEKRQERMYIVFLDELKQKQNVLEERLLQMEEQQRIIFTDKYFGFVSDYVLEEVQEEKVQYLTNGFVNLANHENINEDFVLTYYDTMEQLRLIDIGVLRFYYSDDAYNFYYELLNEFDIEYEQYLATREKLYRLGLLTTSRDNNQDNLYVNMQNIMDFLENTVKGKKNAKLKPYKKIEKKDAFKKSKFGREFFEFFINENE